MKKLNFWLLASLFVGSLAFTACSSSDDDGGGDDPNPPAPAPSADPNNMRFAALTGVVTDGDSPIPGVTVTSGTSSVKTGVNGVYTMDQVNLNKNNNAVVKFEKDGYISVVRSCQKTDEMRLNVVMHLDNNKQDFDAAYGTNVSITYWDYDPSTGTSTPSTMKVDLPADGYVVANPDGTPSATPYSGTVTAHSVYLNPNEDDFAEMMPGDLTTDNNEQLVSLGMVAVDLRGSGNQKLQLKSNTKATLTFPVPANMKVTPSEMRLIPLWSFNESTGLWEKEGMAEYKSDLNAYVGEVSHFSWHNLDYPESRATLKVKVTAADGSIIANIPVDFDGQRTVYTDKNGVASCLVPSDTKMYVRVMEKYYGGNEYSSAEAGRLDNVQLSGGEEKIITLQLKNRAPSIYGVVNNEGGGSKVCVLYVKYNMMETTASVVSDLYGAFKLVGPANYTGSAKLIALFGDGTMAEQEFQMNGADQEVNINVNSGSSAGAGVIMIAGDGLSYQYTLPPTTDGSPYEGTLSERGSDVTISIHHSVNPSEGQDPHMGTSYNLYFNIPNYNASATEFSNCTLEFYRNGHGAGFIESSFHGNLTVIRNGDVWTFKMNNVDGNVYDQDRNLSDAAVKATLEIGAKIALSN